MAALWRMICVFLLVMPLAGCFQDQTKALAECTLDASKRYPDFIEAPIGQPLQQIQLCMKAAGYDWVGTSNGNFQCDQVNIMMGKPDIDDHDAGALCFVPNDGFTRWLYDLGLK